MSRSTGGGRRNKLGIGREIGGRAFTRAKGPYNLYDIYEAVSYWPASERGRVETLAFEKALEKILSRIMRNGPDAVVFQSARDAFAYAKTIRSSATKDSARHLRVHESYLAGLASGSDRRSNGEDLSGGDWRYTAAEDSEFEQEYDRELLIGWLSARVGEADALLLARVYIDGITPAEVSRASGVAESTVRSRLARAEALAREAYRTELDIRALSPRDPACRDECEVVLYNDDEHHFCTVRDALVHHAELDPDTATTCTMTAHYEGKVIVCRAAPVAAQSIVEGLRRTGLRASSSRN